MDGPALARVWPGIQGEEAGKEAGMVLTLLAEDARRLSVPVIIS